MSCDDKSRGAHHALVIIPPLFRSVQPPLGPALLVAGHVSARLVDLNQSWIREQKIALRPDLSQQAFIGHAQHPAESFGACLDALRRVTLGAFKAPVPWGIDDRALDLTYGFDAVVQAAERHALKHLRWIRRQLRANGLCSDMPGICWLHVDSELQVLWALAVGIVARALGSTTVIWSGALVADLADEIATDARYSQHIDGFVPHHPHAVVGRVIDDLAAGAPLPPTVMRAGQGREQPGRLDRLVVPSFTAKLVVPGGRVAIPLRLHEMTEPRCRWCPVPRRTRRARLDVLDAAIAEARARNADLELLDRGFGEDTLDAIESRIDGGSRWSVRCDFQDDHAEALAANLAHAVEAGCRTLYLSLHPHALAGPARAGELPDALLAILRGARKYAVPLVVRRVYGFPGTHEHVDSLIDRLLARALHRFPAPVHRCSLPYRPRRSCFRPSGCTAQRWDLLRTAPWSGVVQPRQRAAWPHDEHE